MRLCDKKTNYVENSISETERLFESVEDFKEWMMIPKQESIFQMNWSMHSYHALDLSWSHLIEVINNEVVITMTFNTVQDHVQDHL